MSIKELMISFGIWISISIVFAFFFYRSIWAFVIIVLFFPLFLKRQRASYREKRKWRLSIEFKEYILIVSVNLASGSSVENAFRRGYEDLYKLFGKSSYMVREVGILSNSLNNNMNLEDLLLSLGKRSDIEEISDFADIFAAGKRSGGNLREIIEDTARQISEKIEMKKELKVIIAEKELEQKIMCTIPFLILTYIGFSNKGYFDILYHNLTGIMIMTGCMISYVVAFLWGENITKQIS